MLMMQYEFHVGGLSLRHPPYIPIFLDLLGFDPILEPILEPIFGLN
jgi:hypothetical protein